MADEVSGRLRSKFCQPCSRKDTRNEASIYCEDCGEFQCEECAKVHQIYPLMAKHKLVNANNSSDVKSKYDMKGLDQCKEHHKLLEFYCEDEDEPCCGKCAIVNHRKCQHVVEIEKIAGQRNTDFSDIKHKMMKLEEKANTIRKRVSTTRDQITNEASGIKEKIQSVQDKVNEMFENLKQSVAKDIAAFQKQAFDDFDTKSTENDSFIVNVKQILTDIQAVSEQGSPAQELIFAKHLENQYAEMQRKTQQLYDGLRNIVLKFDFYDSLKLPPANNSTPGKLTMGFIKGPKMPADIVVVREKERMAKLTMLVSVKLKQRKGDVGEPFYTGLDFLPDGRLVAVDNKNGKCLILNQNLEKKNTFKLTIDPQAVVAVSEEEVVITSGRTQHKLIVLKISKRNEFTVVRECNVTKVYQSVSVIDGDNLLVACQEDPQPVRVVSLRGEERELDIQFPTKTYPFSSSACTYIKSRNKVVVSDRFAHTVFIYDKVNNSRVEVKNEKIVREPRGMAVGPADCILVCSEKTHSIVQICHKGQILSSHELDMLYPYSVCVSKDNTRIAVANSYIGKKKLQLFKIEPI